MDFKCNCKNCELVSTQPIENSTVQIDNFNPNKRYQAHSDTSRLYRTMNIPDRFEHPLVFTGYGNQQSSYNPFYRTTSSEYGWVPPNVHTVPHCYYPRTNEFSMLMAKTGMYRNYSLNTIMDKSFI